MEHFMSSWCGLEPKYPVVGQEIFDFSLAPTTCLSHCILYHSQNQAPMDDFQLTAQQLASLRTLHKKQRDRMKAVRVKARVKAVDLLGTGWSVPEVVERANAPRGRYRSDGGLFLSPSFGRLGYTIY